MKQKVHAKRTVFSIAYLDNMVKWAHDEQQTDWLFRTKAEYEKQKTWYVNARVLELGDIEDDEKNKVKKQAQKDWLELQKNDHSPNGTWVFVHNNPKSPWCFVPNYEFMALSRKYIKLFKRYQRAREEAKKDWLHKFSEEIVLGFQYAEQYAYRGWF